MKRIAYSIVLALVCLYGNTQSIIQGVVYDRDSGDPLIGVNVVLYPVKATTVSGLDGTYQFEIQDTTLPYEIELTYAGYDSEKFKPLIHAVNKTALWMGAQLEEVIVTAAGQRRNKLMGKVAGIQFFDRSTDEVAEPVFPEESYAAIEENGFKRTDQDPVTTFSIDVDRASYANVKRYLQQRQLPPVDAVRIEEMVNYFSYDYPAPVDEHPLTVTSSSTVCPWNKDHRLLRIGLQCKRIETADLPPSNLVFLLDVSGSMDEWNKLPLVKSAMEVLVDQLREEDRVAIVVYAGAAGVVLNATPGSAKRKIKEALQDLEAGGSTAGGAGIKLAYQIAQEHFIADGNNRIILATDGDFNVGIQSAGELQRLIEEQRDKGVYLTCLGFGMGNLKDNNLETLADHGNGNYAYINDAQEAEKIFVREFGGTLFTIAKDVKLQLEFNPHKVQSYRLVGYENRMLENEAFADDKKDAGDLGAGHTVTALYELVPAGVDDIYAGKSEPLKYQQPAKDKFLAEWATLKVRYKKPDALRSQMLEYRIASDDSETSTDGSFAAAVALFGMLLRHSDYLQSGDFDLVLSLAQPGLSNDPEGERAEFIQLVKIARKLNQ